MQRFGETRYLYKTFLNIMDTYLAAYGMDVELSILESYVMQLLKPAEKSSSGNIGAKNFYLIA